MKSGLTIACAAKLHKNQLERHLELLERLDDVSRVCVVRNAPLSDRLSKLEQHPFGKGSLPGEVWGLLSGLDKLYQTQSVDWTLGFNPVPWGSLALLAARRRQVRTCLSLIGMDFLQIQKLWGRPFLEAVRRADAVTVTGRSMRARLMELGVSEGRIRILPHSVDLERFVPGTGEKTIDILAVGQLIRRKRMDLLIDAAKILKGRGQRVSVAILGKGPLEDELKRQAVANGVADRVEFLGYCDDVESVLSNARVFTLASEWEGVPFAMMEAMAAGLVPVVTDVGTIADWVDSGRNGVVLGAHDPEQLANAWQVALGSQGDAMRHQLLDERARLGFEQGAQVWRDIFSQG